VGVDRRIKSCDLQFAQVFAARAGIASDAVVGADFLEFFDVDVRSSAAADFERLKAQYAEMQTSIAHLQSMFAMLKVQSSPVINIQTEVGNMGDKWRDGDKVGRNKISNSDASLKIAVAGFAVMVIAVAWLFYYVATAASETVPTPPHIETPAGTS